MQSLDICLTSSSYFLNSFKSRQGCFVTARANGLTSASSAPAEPRYFPLTLAYPSLNITLTVEDKEGYIIIWELNDQIRVPFTLQNVFDDNHRLMQIPFHDISRTSFLHDFLLDQSCQTYLSSHISSLNSSSKTILHVFM